MIAVQVSTVSAVRTARPLARAFSRQLQIEDGFAALEGQEVDRARFVERLMVGLVKGLEARPPR